MKGTDDIAVCEAAFRMKLPEAPEIARRRLDYWVQHGGPEADRAAECLRQMLRDNLGKWAPRQVAEGPTPETARRVRQLDPFEALYLLDHLDDDQLRNGREIARIVRHITVGPSVKIMRLPVASSPDPDETKSKGERAADVADSAAWTGLLHHNVYRPWAEQQGGNMQLILGLVVDGNSLESLRRRHRMGWTTALRVVSDALDRYGAIRGGYVRHGVQPVPEERPPRAVPAAS